MSVIDSFSLIVFTQAYYEEKMAVGLECRSLLACVIVCILVYIQYIPVSLVSSCLLQLQFSTIASKIVSHWK